MLHLPRIPVRPTPSPTEGGRAYMRMAVLASLVFTLSFFGLAPRALASFSPTFLPDPSYPSGTTLTNTDGTHYYVSYFDDTGLSDEGRINPGESGHPWLYWFNGYATGKHIVVEMSDSGDSSGTRCGYGAGMHLSDCRAADNYIQEFEICLTDEEVCAGGGGGDPDPNVIYDQGFSEDPDDIGASSDFYVIGATGTGTLQYIGAWMKTDEPDLAVSFSLAGQDCSMSEKTLAELEVPVAYLGGTDGLAPVVLGPFTGSDCYIDWDNFTGQAFYTSSTGFTSRVRFGTFDGAAQLIFWATDPGIVTSDNTGIITSHPDPFSTTTTGFVVLGAEGYVHSSDFEDGMRLQITYERISKPFLSLSRTYVPITASGEFDLYATSSEELEDGVYNLTLTITAPIISLFGFTALPAPLANYVGRPFSQIQYNTQFTVGDPPLQDVILSRSFSPFQDSNNPDPEMALCDSDIVSLSWTVLSDCLMNLGIRLFVPDSTTVSLLVDQFRQDFLYRAPWGYATLVTDGLTGALATTTLPSLYVSIPENLPMGGHPFDFSPWGPIEDAVHKIDTTEVDTIDGSPLAAFEGYWNTMWLLVFGFWLFRELYGHRADFTHDDLGGGHGAIRKDARGKRYREYNNADTKRFMKKGQGRGIIH